MNIVFLTSEEIHHYYLINEINDFHKIKKVFFQRSHIEHVTFRNRFRRAANPRKFGNNFRSLLMKILFRKEKALRKQYEVRQFFNNATPALNPKIPSEKVLSFNIPEVAEKVKKEEPDLIIVFGTEVLRGAILDIARLEILNIHRNILPDYRGGGLPSWIFYNKDFNTLGTTIHICTKSLDAGDIVGQRYYQLQKDDRYYTLRYKTTVLTVDLLKEVISQYIQGTVNYRKQEKSKLWTSRDMTVIKEIKARRNLKQYIDTL